MTAAARVVGLALAAMELLLPAVPRARAASGGDCGEVVTLETHDRTTMRYALAVPAAAPGPDSPVALVLLVGGGGHVDLDARGCPRALTGNSLLRFSPIFRAAGFVTVVVDAPSDRQGEDGLGGFRTSAAHAADLGGVVADVRRRAGGPVWLVGSSRGSISAANAAARLSGVHAADGLVLTSALMSGSRSAQKRWVADTVFDLPLEAIRMPVLIVGHANDACARSPASLMGSVAARIPAARKQVVTVTGGPGGTGFSSIAACEGRAPHGFIEQEAEVVAGIVRFIRGGPY